MTDIKAYFSEQHRARLLDAPRHAPARKGSPTPTVVFRDPTEPKIITIWRIVSRDPDEEQDYSGELVANLEHFWRIRDGEHEVRDFPKSIWRFGSIEAKS